jgi:2-polyprenyl-3-methyl-5-hydroxy-6-metoxy-1,4-benzoquinol methylase
MKCRHCGEQLNLQFADLASSPPSNAYISARQLKAVEKWYPLAVYVCTHCWLVQTEDYAHHSELFASDYAYFSSVSTSWLDHARRYVNEMISRYHLNAHSQVVEVASNDGYLLQYFHQLGIPSIGIEPTTSTAAVARSKGIEVVEDFFGVSLAERLLTQGRAADLLIANNVLAHVPDINDFVAGFARLLKPDGVATFEFPHLLRLVENGQFDTIYHEHFSYLSITAVEKIFLTNGLKVFDIQEIPTHGGSLRVYAQRSDTGQREKTKDYAAVVNAESLAGLQTESYYLNFQIVANRIKDDFADFLIQAKRSGKRVGGYGAAAKGNTLLNYAGIRSDLLPWVADRNEAKQGKFMPGSHIPIVAEQYLKAQRPDYVVVFPWNLRDEVVEQLSYIRGWGGRFVTAVPKLEIL